MLTIATNSGLLQMDWYAGLLLGTLGLLVGSFLNVVIYRLPKMLERQWAAECEQFAGKEAAPVETFNLMLPRSRCPHCGHPIAWYENIPVLSYLALVGKCSACKAGISPRYPLVEIAVAALFFYCIWTFGANPSGYAWCAFSAILLTAALIDWDTTLLPDDIVLPLLWLGLISAQLQWTQVLLANALWGAVGGYLFLWS